MKAIETKKYGWFWECPAGGDKCQYRHALPQGYVFQSTKKKEKVETRPLEEILEEKVYHSLFIFLIYFREHYYLVLD